MPTLGLILGSVLGGQPATIGLNPASGSFVGSAFGPKGRASQAIAAAVASSLNLSYKTRVSQGVNSVLATSICNATAKGRASQGVYASVSGQASDLAEKTRVFISITAAGAIWPLTMMQETGRADQPLAAVALAGAAIPTTQSGRASQNVFVIQPTVLDLVGKGKSDTSIQSVMLSALSAAAIGRGRSSIANNAADSTLVSALSIAGKGRADATATAIPATLTQDVAVKSRVFQTITAIAAIWPATPLAEEGQAEWWLDPITAASLVAPMDPHGMAKQGIEHTGISTLDIFGRGRAHTFVNAVTDSIINANAVATGRASQNVSVEETGIAAGLNVKTRVKILITASASIWPLSMMQGMGRADEPLDTVELVSDVGALDRNTGRASQGLDAIEQTPIVPLGPKVATVRQIQAALGSIGNNHLTSSGRAAQAVNITGVSELNLGIRAAIHQSLAAATSPFQNAGALPRVRTYRHSGAVATASEANLLDPHGKAAHSVTATGNAEVSLGFSIRSHTSLLPSILHSVTQVEAKGKSNVGVEVGLDAIASEMAFQIRAHKKLGAATGTSVLDAAVQTRVTTELPFTAGLSSLSIRPKGKGLEPLPSVLTSIFSNVEPRTRVSQGTSASATTGTGKLGLKSRVRVMPPAIEVNAAADIVAKVATVRQATPVVIDAAPAAMGGTGRASTGIVATGYEIDSGVEDLFAFSGLDPRLMIADLFSAESGFTAMGFVDGIPISQVVTFRESLTSENMYAVVGVPGANVSKPAPEGYRKVSGKAQPFTNVDVYKIVAGSPPVFLSSTTADKDGNWMVIIWA